MNRLIIVLISLITILSCKTNSRNYILQASKNNATKSGVSLIVLGTVQDAGSPHAGCKKSCCADLFQNPDPSRKVVSLGIVDHNNNKKYLFEATPDLPSQMKNLLAHVQVETNETPDGIFLTHAHIGHYTGLMYLGRESMNADRVQVYTMPIMSKFLSSNGPWDQLLKLNNISINTIENNERVTLSPDFSVTPFKVPHRDEYSETVGYILQGPNKKALFIPDIDKWEKWETDIIQAISQVDYAFLDATFYDAAEIAFRNIKEIPHPFIIESMEKFSHLPLSEKKKVYFIHLNHTNPALNPKSDAYKTILKNGFNCASINLIIDL